MSITTPMRKRPTTVGRSEDEMFERLSVDALVSLMLQAVQAQQEQEMVIKAVHAGSSKISSMDAACDRAYLLLDVRLADEFADNHIVTAVNFAHTSLSRETIAPEMHRYKNKAGHLIVCYDDREFDAPRVVTTLLQRGFDNVAMLSGGISQARLIYPDSFVTCKQPIQANGKGRKKSNPSKPTMPPPDVELASELDDNMVDSLRRQLETRLQSNLARGRYMLETAAGRQRRLSNEELIRSRKKSAPWKL